MIITHTLNKRRLTDLVPRVFFKANKTTGTNNMGTHEPSTIPRINAENPPKTATHAVAFAATAAKRSRVFGGSDVALTDSRSKSQLRNILNLDMADLAVRAS